MKSAEEIEAKDRFQVHFSDESKQERWSMFEMICFVFETAMFMWVNLAFHYMIGE